MSQTNISKELAAQLLKETGVDVNDAAHERCRELNAAGKYRYSVSSNDKVFAWGPDGKAWAIDAAGELLRPWTSEDQNS